MSHSEATLYKPISRRNSISAPVAIRPKPIYQTQRSLPDARAMTKMTEDLELDAILAGFYEKSPIYKPFATDKLDNRPKVNAEKMYMSYKV